MSIDQFDHFAVGPAKHKFCKSKYQHIVEVIVGLIATPQRRIAAMDIGRNVTKCSHAKLVLDLSLQEADVAHEK